MANSVEYQTSRNGELLFSMALLVILLALVLDALPNSTAETTAEGTRRLLGGMAHLLVKIAMIVYIAK